MIKKPMLAAPTKGKTDEITQANMAKVEANLPLLASPKLDGIRMLHHPEHGCITRSFKPIPNDYIRLYVERFFPFGLDGEVVTLNPDGSVRTFNQIQADVMSKMGNPEFQYLVFDDFTNKNNSFSVRLKELEAKCATTGDSRLVFLDHDSIHNMTQLYEYTQASLDCGYEGAMFRHPMGLYKEGRSTVKQTWLIKMKQFEDDEGVITGFEERMHNANTATVSNTGHTERSSHKGNMVPMGTLGALIVDTKWGVLKVGSGFNDVERHNIWEGQSFYKGKTITFTYQPFGAKDKPRFPTFKGFRDSRDNS